MNVVDMHGRSTARRPISSVVPMSCHRLHTAPRHPHRKSPRVMVAPVAASLNGVRPNSPPQTTSVSLRSPRLSGPAAAPLSACLKRRTSSCDYLPCRRGHPTGYRCRNTLLRSVHRARPGAAPCSSSCRIGLPFGSSSPYIFRVSRIRSRCSTASGAAVCMRYASSYDSIRPVVRCLRAYLRQTAGSVSRSNRACFAAALHPRFQECRDREWAIFATEQSSLIRCRQETRTPVLRPASNRFLIGKHYERR